MASIEVSFILLTLLISMVWAIRPVPQFEPSKDCAKPFKQSIIVPLGSSYILQCPTICDATNQKNEQPSWFFLNASVPKIFQIGKNFSNYIISPSDWSLHVKRITQNGTFFCQHSSKIQAIHSVTTTRILKRASLVQNSETEEVKHFKTENGLEVRYKFETKYETPCTARKPEEESKSIGLKRHITIAVCNLTDISQLTEPYLLKFHFLPNLSCHDFGLEALGREQLPKSPIKFNYELCPPKQPPNGDSDKWLQNKFNESKKIYFSTSFSNVEFENRKSIQLSCNSSINEFLWKKVDKDRSQYLSPLQLHKRSSNHMEIDFLNNLHIRQLQSEDSGYKYQCWYETTLVHTFELSIPPKSLLSSIVRSLFIWETFCIIGLLMSILFLAFAIYGNDVSSKL